MIDVMVAFVGSGIRRSTPLIFASLGGTYSERSGVVNIGLEGMMLVGAFVAIVAGNAFGLIGGIVIAALAGALMGLLHAVATVTFRANQIVSGVAINLLGMGLTAFIPEAVFGQSNVDSLCTNIPRIWSFTPLVFVAIAFVILSHLILFKTVFGLRLRSVGENPKSADTLGISVERMRYTGVMISGVLAALGGAYLSIENSGCFTKNMVAGRGFIALAAMIFGGWTPFGALGACLLFGFAESMQTILQTFGIDLPPQIIQLLPYILTIVVLAVAVKRIRPPEADGKPYER
jgi:nucleoside ABC transporter membrane protein